MVTGTVRIIPTPARREEVLEVLRSVQGPVLAQPGCSACDIYEEQSAERAIVFVERWESEASLETHLRSEAYDRILSAMEMAGKEPDVRFERVITSEGMELVERSRGRLVKDAGPLIGRGGKS